MTTASEGALRQPGLDDRARTATTPVEEGDLVRWQGRLATVDDVAALAPGATFVTISFVDGRGMPVCLSETDLAGADLWHHAGRIPEPAPNSGRPDRPD